jgi:hypothetical protein
LGFSTRERTEDPGYLHPIAKSIFRRRQMKAAIVTEYGKTPTYGEFRDPVAAEGETLVRVHAAPLSPIVKALASGTHYTSGAEAGFVPGVDGVGTDPTGRRVYFLLWFDGRTGAGRK